MAAHVSTNPQLAAFHRLLTDAHRGGQVKVDALLALSQRTVFVVPWPGGIEGYRTLVNSDGVAALPLFSDSAQLEEAARRYGWLDASSEAPRVEIGARAAFNYADGQNLSFVVVDIAADHALEIGAEEFKPLLSAAARRDSSGPYAGAGRISSTLIQAVRPTPPPETPRAVPVPRVGATESEASEGFTASTGFDATSEARFGGGSGARIQPLSEDAPDELYDALSVVIRDFPEVEWACLCQVARGPSDASPGIGVRVDTGFRQRINDIIGGLRTAGEAQGAALQVILLDDPELMRSARAQGVVFYPWRK